VEGRNPPGRGVYMRGKASSVGVYMLNRAWGEPMVEVENAASERDTGVVHSAVGGPMMLMMLMA
jgi:hypothetical protein